MTSLRENFPNAQYAGSQWIGALVYVDDLCLCADSVEELNRMITVTQHWVEDHRTKMHYNGTTLGSGPQRKIKFTSTTMERSVMLIIDKGPNKE